MAKIKVKKNKDEEFVFEFIPEFCFFSLGSFDESNEKFLKKEKRIFLFRGNREKIKAITSDPRNLYMNIYIDENGNVTNNFVSELSGVVYASKIFILNYLGLNVNPDSLNGSVMEKINKDFFLKEIKRFNDFLNY